MTLPQQKSKLKKYFLWKEIIIIFAVKATILFAIWKICFSDPVENHLNLKQMRHQLLSDKK